VKIETGKNRRRPVILALRQSVGLLVSRSVGCSYQSNYSKQELFDKITKIMKKKRQVKK
jgi:hypothetical protein